ncbi:LamG domain-containing protein [Streptomyces sp. NBC_00841]|uniref:LamG domain-containing protein n=1 Tax=Streptomyces sp. NBC_00841 TaxID=2975847 RepID=UPI002DD8B6D0|nr:LamG domain-containing protein [Streptomyces sp. NBC_00841]WRZ96862.1 LamG domain-containing protein [Streptomyces sp. NBC_00841]
MTSDWLPAREVKHFPAVSNSWGAVGSSPNVLGIRNFTLAPYLDGGGDSCVLSVDGVPVTTSESRWSAYEITRKATTASGVAIQTATRLAFERNELLLRITVSNPTAAPVTVSVNANPRIAKGALPAKWEWDPPRPGGNRTFTAHKVSRSNLLISDSASSAVTAFAFAPAPTLTMTSAGGSAQWPVAAGQSATIDIVMEVGQTSTGAPLADINDGNGVVDACNATLGAFGAAFSTARKSWEERWQDAFTPGNGHYSGSLPVLTDTRDTAVAGLYYMSVLSVLACERTNLSSEFSTVLGRPTGPGTFQGLDRVYVTGAPEWANTVSYFWDTSYSSIVLTLLDPQMIKAKAAYWLTKDIYAGYAIDWVSGKTVGPWYSANDLTVFTTILNYVNYSGDVSFLDTTISSSGKTVLEHLKSIATNWQRLVPQGQSLADYGENHNLLEVLPKYVHQVPSFNAANVWMMQQAAGLFARAGDKATAKDLTGRAEALLSEVLKLYDIANNGVWNCRYNDGTTVAVRHVLDFAIAGNLLAPSLTDEQKTDMKHFVTDELLAGDWLRALSFADSQAPVARTDHGTSGAYVAWPSLTAQTFARFGDYPAFLSLLKRFAGVTRNGPFGQANEILQSAGASVTDRPALNPAGAVTVSAWINPSSWPKNHWEGSIIAKDTWVSGNAGYVLRGGAGGKISFVLALDGRFIDVITTATVPTSGWHHVAGVYDGEKVQIFIDGTVRTAQPATGKITPSTGTPVIVGNNPTDSNRRFSGSIDEARIYARALSATEINAQYEATTPATGATDSSLVLRLPFSEGNGTKTTESITAQAVTIEGATWSSSRTGFGSAVALSDAAADYHAVIAPATQLQVFVNCAGGKYADVIISDLFGYIPDGATARLQNATMPRGITATLSGVVLNGKSQTISSGPDGLSLA